MSIRAGYWVDLTTAQFNEDGKSSWIQGMTTGTYNHPVHGEIKLTEERISRFAENVNAKVRGTDLDIDYDHKAGTTEAAGWVTAAEARPEGLFLLVEWTEEGAKKVKSRAYRYFSPEFADEWTHPKSGTTFKDVLFGGGITNRPFLKDILPINMSDLVLEDHSPSSGGKYMDPKELRTKLGLPEDATDDQVDAALASKKTEPEPVPAPVAASDPEVAKLAETNPAVKALMEQVAAQNTQLAEMQKTVRLAEAERTVKRLSDEIGSKGYALPAVVLNELPALFASMPTALSDTIFKLLSDLGKAGLVKLGETGVSTQNHDGGDNGTKGFNDLVKAKVEKGMSFSDAVEAASREDWKGYEAYRNSSYSFRDLNPEGR